MLNAIYAAVDELYLIVGALLIITLFAALGLFVYADMSAIDWSSVHVPFSAQLNINIPSLNKK